MKRPTLIGRFVLWAMEKLGILADCRGIDYSEINKEAGGE